MTQTPEKKKPSYHLLWWAALLLLPVALKISGVLDWPWWIVLIPYDIYAVILLFAIASIGFKAIHDHRQQDRIFDELIEADTPEKREEAERKWELLKHKYDARVP